MIEKDIAIKGAAYLEIDDGRQRRILILEPEYRNIYWLEIEIFILHWRKLILTDG
jgi:hypothetical protein